MNLLDKNTSACQQSRIFLALNPHRHKRSSIVNFGLGREGYSKTIALCHGEELGDPELGVSDSKVNKVARGHDLD
jgi:hypothetical protein